MKFTDEQLRVLLEERAARQSALTGISSLKEKILSELFQQQVDSVEDKHTFKSVLGSRRAGKTEMWARYATIMALENPRSLTRIWHSSRLRAKDMLWAAFNYLHARHGIHTKTNETELSITFDNGAVIRLVGADKDKEAQKKRGDKTILEILLEVQNFGSFLRSMIDDVIEPSLLDLNGTLCVEGTPGAICVGPWFEISGDEPSARRWMDAKTGRWSNHRWTLLDNPHLPHARKYLEEQKRSRKWGDDHPTYLREYCGVWVQDSGALFYKFDYARNTYAPHEIQPWGPGWQHALGWDLGFRDDMALVIWGWHPDHENLYEVFSWKRPGALAKEVMDTIQEQETSKNLNIIEQVADTGGGGKMYVEEVMSRYARSFTPAKKTEKYEHVRMFNDEMLSGRIKLRSGSLLQEEMAALMKDPDWPPPEKPEAPPREDPSTPNHCADASLYSWRACWHYVEKPLKRHKPVRGSEKEVLDWLDKASRMRQNRADPFDDAQYGFGANDESNS